MMVSILFFSSLRDYVGVKSLEMEIPVETTVALLKEKLAREYRPLSSFMGSVMTAINGEYASDDQVIAPDAEIAFFPPVSGG